MNVTKLTVKCLGGASLRPRRRDKRGLSSLGRLGQPGPSGSHPHSSSCDLRLCRHLPQHNSAKQRTEPRRGESASLCRDEAPVETWPGPRGAKDHGRSSACAQRPSIPRKTEVTVPKNCVCACETRERAVMLCCVWKHRFPFLDTHVCLFSALPSTNGHRGFLKYFPRQWTTFLWELSRAVPVRTAANYHAF